MIWYEIVKWYLIANNQPFWPL